MKNMFPKIPIMGLTATSTSHVTEDVKKILNIQKCLVFKSPLNRPNLFYEVRPKPDSHEGCLSLIENLLQNEFRNQFGIIYTLTIKDVETLKKDLKAKGLKVGQYHAHMEAHDRNRVHRNWLNGTYQAVVATIAFGMGIDKPGMYIFLHRYLIYIISFRSL